MTRNGYPLSAAKVEECFLGSRERRKREEG